MDHQTNVYAFKLVSVCVCVCVRACVRVRVCRRERHNNQFAIGARLGLTFITVISKYFTMYNLYNLGNFFFFPYFRKWQSFSVVSNNNKTNYLDVNV